MAMISVWPVLSSGRRYLQARCLDGLESFALFSQLVFSNCPVVVDEIGGELVAPVLSGNKIKVVRFVGKQRVDNGFETRVGDGPRG